MDISESTIPYSPTKMPVIVQILMLLIFQLHNYISSDASLLVFHHLLDIVALPHLNHCCLNAHYHHCHLQLLMKVKVINYLEKVMVIWIFFFEQWTREMIPRLMNVWMEELVVRYHYLDMASLLLPTSG